MYGLLGRCLLTVEALLDDLDKELNTYAMRAREWYGWHFPELGKIIPENVLFAKTVLTLGSFCSLFSG